MSVLVESTPYSWSIHILLEIPAWDWWGTGAGWTRGLTLHSYSELVQKCHTISTAPTSQKLCYCPARSQCGQDLGRIDIWCVQWITWGLGDPSTSPLCRRRVKERDLPWKLVIFGINVCIWCSEIHVSWKENSAKTTTDQLLPFWWNSAPLFSLGIFSLLYTSRKVILK